LCAISGACAGAGDARAPLPLRHIVDISLSGNATRLDYQSFDASRHMLFIAHMGDGAVIAVDTQRRRVVATIPNISNVHGVLAVPVLHTVFASATGTNEIVGIDESTFKITGRWKTGAYPDGIAFEPRTRHVFVSNERGGTDTVIDLRHSLDVATIPLGGEVGNTQYDAASGHIFANAEGLGALVEIDPSNNRVLRRTPLTGCRGNHGLLIDARRRRAFIACEDNATLLWIDLRTMRTAARWHTGENPDVLALDSKNERLYAASESGIVAIFSAGARPAPIARGFLAAGAHTVAIDPSTHVLYVPLENVGGHPVLRLMAPQVSAPAGTVKNVSDVTLKHVSPTADRASRHEKR
jgi:DNA-binding beta-propeller fold protein YncE